LVVTADASRRSTRGDSCRSQPPKRIDRPVQIREVLLVDTDDFRLCRNAFILRSLRAALDPDRMAG
jgi:hypothetical protein